MTSPMTKLLSLLQVSNRQLLLTDFQGVGYNLVDPEISSLQLFFQVSNRQLLLTDFQGVGYNLVDPEISSLQLRDDEQQVRGDDNFGIDFFYDSGVSICKCFYFKYHSEHIL